MTTGSPESLVFFAIILCVAIFLWAMLLRLFKIRSLSLAFALGYISIAVYAYLKGWRPLDIGGFDPGASEAVTLSWPATLLLKHLKHKMYYVILVVAVLQYCAAGWVFEMLLDSVVGGKK